MPHHDFAAGFVIFRLNDHGARAYLIMKNVAGHWELPKGHPKPGETWIQTAIRELKEETGLTNADPVPGFARQIKYVFRDRGLGVIYKTVCFAMTQTQSHRVRLSDEHKDFAFLEIEAAIHRLTHAGPRAVLRDAEEFLSNNNVG